jgi:hypothetical protein
MRIAIDVNDNGAKYGCKRTTSASFGIRFQTHRLLLPLSAQHFVQASRDDPHTFLYDRSVRFDNSLE